jgi:hypothetical protein
MQNFKAVTTMRIFTCTPVAFGGGVDFFTRESGLLCRGLQRFMGGGAGREAFALGVIE